MDVEVKRTLRIAKWKIMGILSFGLWCVAMYFDPVHLSDESFLTRQWFIVGLLVIIALFCTSVFVWTAKIKSAKIAHCQGNDTWDPTEWYDIPEETEDGKIVLPALKICGVGGFKALGVYFGGKGEKGWHIVVDIPGIWYRLGANLILNTDVRVTSIGKYEHDDVYNIIDRMNRYILGTPGLMNITDNTPLYIYGIPRKYPTIDKEFIHSLADLEAAERWFSVKLKQEKDANLDTRMKLDRERGSAHGFTDWKNVTKTKGTEDNEADNNG